MRSRKNINRIYCLQSLELGATIDFDGDIHNYLVKVLRCKVGSKVKVFNAEHGEWLAEVTNVSKKSLTISLLELLKKPPKRQQPTNLTLIFAPVKNPNPSFYIQKATELGATKIVPVITSRTVVRNLNTDKLTKVAIEATEQSERLAVPQIHGEMSLLDLKDKLNITGTIFFFDEDEQNNNFLKILTTSFDFNDDAILIGPEGGFSDDERATLRTLPNIKSVSLGRNILRAETAMIAALSVYELAKASSVTQA